MASAILTSRNDSQSRNHTRNFTNNRNFNSSNPNPNPEPYSSNFFIPNINSSRNVNRNVAESNHQQFSFQNPHQQSAFIHSSYGYRYITFRLSSFTKTELIHLQKRLSSDLERVRILQQWIHFTTTPKLTYQQPEVKLPVTSKPQKRTVNRKRNIPLPLPPVRENKKQCGRMKTNVQNQKMMIMKKCEQILGKVMTHKHGWVFNTPVDAVALKLYDYHNIIHNPMDLGTVKSKLARNEYVSPLAFASDVRLTFQNAMVYNGRGSAVFIMAERLLMLFESLFGSINQKPVANPVEKEKQKQKPEVLRMPVVRVMKKAEMTDEEKAELAGSFTNLRLGPEGMNRIMAIVKKGVSGFKYQGDEVEVDLAVLDNDTLLALRDFIAQTRKEVDHCAGNECVVEEEQEEDVDIGEEMQLTEYPSVEIEKDTVNVSSSESSSDSDTTSSSGDSKSVDSCNEQEVNSTPKVLKVT